MRMECVAILLLIGIMIFSFLRARRYSFAIAISPLTAVPAMHLMGFILSKHISNLFSHLSTTDIHVGIDILAAVLCCLLLGIFSHYFTSKKTRSTFLVLSSVFELLLTWVLIYNLKH